MIDGPPSRFGLNELSIPAISPGGGFDRHRRHLASGFAATRVFIMLH
jgi:hypothetical protein